MKKYNKLSDNDKERIIDIYNNSSRNQKFKELAEGIGVTKSAFSRVLRESGINTKRKNKYTLNENYFDEIKYRLTDGEDANQVILDIIERDMDNMNGLIWFLKRRVEEYIQADNLRRFL